MMILKSILYFSHNLNLILLKMYIYRWLDFHKSAIRRSQVPFIRVFGGSLT